MPHYLLGYLSSLIVFCIMDFLWLAIAAKKFYLLKMGSLMLAEPNWVAAIAFYLLYNLGLLVFVILPAMRAQNIYVAAGFGALFGLITYSCYDLTNLATLKNWSIALTLVDITWGIIVSALSATASIIVIRMLQKTL